MLSDYRGPEILDVFKARMNQNKKFKNDIKSRFVRSIRRLAQLSKFAHLMGQELEIDLIEIARLTDKENEDLMIREEDPPHVVKYKEEQVKIYQIINLLSIKNLTHSLDF